VESALSQHGVDFLDGAAHGEHQGVTVLIGTDDDDLAIAAIPLCGEPFRLDDRLRRVYPPAPARVSG
jgi:hypothetical protein